MLDELSAGVAEWSAQRLALLRDVPLGAVEPEVVEIVQGYITGTTARCKHLCSQPTAPELELGALNQLFLHGVRTQAKIRRSMRISCSLSLTCLRSPLDDTYPPSSSSGAAIYCSPCVWA